MKLLLLADTSHPAMAVQDHIRATTDCPTLNWFIENPLTCKILHKLNLATFDAIGIHYSIKIYNEYYLCKQLKEKIKKYTGIKFVFLQDEYQHVNKTSACLADLKVDILFTLVDQENIELAYPYPELKPMKKVTVLTAYVPDSIKNISPLPLSDRPLDIFYRSRIYPFSLGYLAQERVAIAHGVKERVSEYDLNCDISVNERDRIYGQAWINKMQSSRAVLGTESGASIWDFTGDIKKKTKYLLKKYPDMKFKVASKLLLSEHENKVPYAAISPRIFEAAALRTAMILFPGNYNGILKEELHYIALKKDFSNFSEVVNKLKNDDYIKVLTERTYTDLILAKEYSAKQLCHMVEKELLLLKKSFKQEMHLSNQRVFEYLSQVKKKNRMTNVIYVFIAECKFIMLNFFIFMFDSPYKGTKKLYALSEGMKRYAFYMANRLMKLNIGFGKKNNFE
ncbi:hypothetical protein [Rickettsiella endosymbiont of Dermanyssus gallinae]|uniref:hypothetical protein n=1 Tax=Rickettsiella endosymbiont of Dermanyssus gallinae TaxID=2856608 RepID=UPI001C52D68C|nr:hypothetical protein [Rickettsiella endosymbiont of Dermanyssus gallinae]